MSAEWAPNQDELSRVVGMLQALRDPTRHDHQLALQALGQTVTEPAFVLHVMHIFVHGAAYESMGLSPDARQLAGLVIKNYAFPHFHKMPPSVQQIMKQDILRGLSDAQINIRSTAGLLVGRIAETYAVETWGDMLPTLLQMLDLSSHGQTAATEGALQAVKRITEDSLDKISKSSTRQALEAMIPKLIVLFSCPEESVRLNASDCMSNMLYLLCPMTGSIQDLEASSEHQRFTGLAEDRIAASQPLIVNMTEFLKGLALLSGDSSPKVRKSVCQSISLLATFQIAILQPLFGSICEFMLKNILDVDEGVAVEACQFWVVLSDSGVDTMKLMEPLLPRLLPNLIARMKFTEEEVAQERAEEEAQATGAKEVSFKPIHHRTNKNSDDDDAKDEEEASQRWTVRKQAAMIVDDISMKFPATTVLPAALPAIEQALQNTGDVWVRESGLLALGALSSGCYGDMGSYLPNIFPFFLQSLADDTPEIKSIACWVISRYCGWIFDFQHVDGTVAHRLFTEMMDSLLKTMGDPRPKVQASVCSCICAVAETAGPEIIPSLPALFTHINMAFGFYGIKNRLILFDSIGTIADVVGEAVADPRYLQLFFPKVLEAFDSLEDDNMHLFPIMECLSSVLGAIGLESQGYAQAIYFRAVRIVGNTLMAHSAGDAKEGGVGDDDDLPSKDFIVCGLDVLSSLCTGLEENFVILAEGSKETLLQLLFACIRDTAPEVRQSAFALAGEISKNAAALLGATIGQLITACIENFNPETPLVANNAFWTIGELAVKVGGEPIAPFIPQIIHATVQLLHVPEREVEPVLRENISITVGRLGVTNTAQVAEYLPEFFEPWCKALCLTHQSHEKDHAFAGLIKLVTAKPETLFAPASVGVVIHFVQACASWEDPPIEPLLTELGQILQVLKGNSSIWKIATTSLGRDIISNASDMFRLS